MENQINVGDQNNQQIGQNSIDQTVTTSLKPKKNIWMYISLILVFLLIISFVGFSILIKTQKSIPVSQTSPFPTPIINAKPIYTSSDYVVFAHYNLGYTVEYPATNEDLHLVGATGGNFTQKYNDGSSILIYDIYPEENSVSKINIDNIIQQLSECGEGGCSKFFEYKDYEKLLEKKIVNLDGINAFLIKTIIPEGSTNKLPPYVSIESATIERYLVPQKNRFLILELNYKDKITSELSKAISSFKLIPNIPTNWVEYKDVENSKIRFKHPNNYKVTENNQKKQIILTSADGTIIINYFDKTEKVFSFFANQTSYPYFDLNSAYEAENYLGSEITKFKFSINTFTYSQGGDVAVRVLRPEQQEISIYFYANGSPLIYRVSFPLKLEMVINQIMMSVNELMK